MKPIAVKNDFQNALHYFEVWKSVQDSINQINNLSTIAGLESKYKNKEQKEQIEFHVLEIARQRKLRNAFIIFFSFLAFLMIGLIGLLLKVNASRKKIKRQNEVITKQSDKLLDLDKVKSRFFANVSHELRTPLTLILGPISSALKSGDLNNRNFTLLKKAQDSGKDLLKLIASILDLSKMETGENNNQ